MKQTILGIFFSIIILNTSCASTLMQALSEAYKKNPRLNAERENLKISKENINEAKSEFLPTITISGYISDEKMLEKQEYLEKEEELAVYQNQISNLVSKKF